MASLKVRRKVGIMEAQQALSSSTLEQLFAISEEDEKQMKAAILKDSTLPSYQSSQKKAQLSVRISLVKENNFFDAYKETQTNFVGGELESLKKLASEHLKEMGLDEEDTRANDIILKKTSYSILTKIQTMRGKLQKKHNDFQKFENPDQVAGLIEQISKKLEELNPVENMLAKIVFTEVQPEALDSAEKTLTDLTLQNLLKNSKENMFRTAKSEEQKNNITSMLYVKAFELHKNILGKREDNPWNSPDAIKKYEKHVEYLNKTPDDSLSDRLTAQILNEIQTAKMMLQTQRVNLSRFPDSEQAKEKTALILKRIEYLDIIEKNVPANKKTLAPQHIPQGFTASWGKGEKVKGERKPEPITGGAVKQELITLDSEEGAKEKAKEILNKSNLEKIKNANEEKMSQLDSIKKNENLLYEIQRIQAELQKIQVRLASFPNSDEAKTLNNDISSRIRELNIEIERTHSGPRIFKQK